MIVFLQEKLKISKNPTEILCNFFPVEIFFKGKYPTWLVTYINNKGG